MEVVKRAKQSFRFKALKSFRWAGRDTHPGELLEEIPEPTATGLVAIGKIKPELPEVSIYVCLQAITIPGEIEKHTAKKMERVLLRAEDALPLLISGAVIPEADGQWRPLGRRLKGRTAPTGRRQ
jgi:hypothetical protein